MCSTQLYSRTHFQFHRKKSSESNVAMCNVFLCFLQYLLHELKNCSVSEWQAALKSIDNMGWRKSDREESHFRDITVWRGMVSASKTAHSNPDLVFTSLYTPQPSWTRPALMWPKIKTNKKPPNLPGLDQKRYYSGSSGEITCHATETISSEQSNQWPSPICQLGKWNIFENTSSHLGRSCTQISFQLH